MSFTKIQMKLLLAVTLSILSTSVMAITASTGSISVNNHDNIPNAAGDADIFSDTYLEAKFDLGKTYTPAVGKNLTISAQVETRTYDDTTGLNRFNLGANLSYTQRFGLGAYAPRVKTFVSLQQLNFKENLRDGRLLKLGIGFEKRFTPALRFESDIQYESRNANQQNSIQYSTFINKDVFSQNNRELNIALEYTFENYSSLTVRYRYRDGEATTTTQVGSGLASFSKAIAWDSALGNNHVVYLLNSSSQTYGLNWSLPLSDDMAFDLGFERRLADAQGNNKYRSTIMSAQLTYRFK